MLVKIVNILILILTAYIIIGVSTKGHPPKIFLPEEYVLHSNQNLTIKCEASEPIFWTYPKNTINGEKFSHFVISYSNTSEENVHVAILDIVNISFVDTGFYYCHGIGQSLDSNGSSKIYLFVKDDEHLTVLDEIETIYTANPYSEAILPCRPTAPDTNVKLYRSSDDSEVQPGQRQEDGSLVKFDPRYGFIFVKHADEEINWDQTMVYICSFFRDHITQNITMLHIMQPMMTSIALPHIEDLNLGHSIEGDTLRLKCTLVCNVQFSMIWTVPNPNGFETGRITESSVDSTDSNTHFKMLTITNVTKADQGSYTCLVEDMRNINNNSLEVKIYGTDDHFINLMEENNVYNITERAGVDSVQWCIKVDAHPIKNLLAEWYNNKNELIKSVDATKYNVYLSPKEAVLKINRVKIEDFGNYTLLVKNGFETAKMQLFLTVTDKPTVHIDMEDIHFIGTQSTAKCISVGYPPPDIFWYFKPCLDNACPFKEIVSNGLQINGLQTISEISIKASETGVITCLANNSLGVDSHTIPFYTTDKPSETPLYVIITGILVVLMICFIILIIKIIKQKKLEAELKVVGLQLCEKVNTPATE